MQVYGLIGQNEEGIWPEAQLQYSVFFSSEQTSSGNGYKSFSVLTASMSVLIIFAAVVMIRFFSDSSVATVFSRATACIIEDVVSFSVTMSHLS